MGHTIQNFVLTYGFQKNVRSRKGDFACLTQKIACFEEKAEIHWIGYTQYDRAFRQDIHVLVWENRVIPFIVDTRQITEKILPSKCRISIVSVLIYDIGKDLKKIQSSRENFVTYSKDFFSGQEKHGYEFLSETEYSEAKELIRGGISVLLADSYAFDPLVDYKPMLTAEIIFKEPEQNNAFYGSTYRKTLHIRWLLETMAKEEPEAELLRLKKQRKKHPEFRKVYDESISRHNSAKKTARIWMKDLKKSVKSVEDFMQFCVTHPEPSEPVRGCDIIQAGENQKYFFALLATSENPILEQFQDFQDQLVQQVLRDAEKFLPVADNAAPYHVSIESLEDEFKDKARAGHMSIEAIMCFLIGRELRFGWYYNTNILKESWFLDILRKTYHEKYSDICSSFEDFLVSITEIMVQRSIYRKFTLSQKEPI